MSLRPLLACAVFLGCAPEAAQPPTVVVAPPPPVASTAAPDDSGVAARGKSIPAAEVILAFRGLGESVRIDPAVADTLACTVVTLNRSEIAGPDAADRLARVLRRAQFRVERSEGGWLVSADPSAPPAACAPAAAPSTVAPAITDSALAEIVKPVRRVSGTEYVMPRSTLDSILEHQADLFKSVRVVPETEGSKAVGLRIFGVRADGALARLGFENGDRVERLGGFEISDPQKALEAYVALRKATKAVLEIDRHGSKVKITYRIQ